MRSPAATKVDHEDELADLAQFILTVAREIRFRGYDDNRAQALSHLEAHVMTYIDAHPGATASAVARGTGLQRSNLSAALRGLQARGFVRRQTDPDDGRGVNLYPTDRSAKNLMVIRAEWARHVADALGADRTGVVAATRLLARLQAGLADERRD